MNFETHTIETDPMEDLWALKGTIVTPPLKPQVSSHETICKILETMSDFEAAMVQIRGYEWGE